MLTRPIPTSLPSSHDGVGYTSQNIPIRCGVQRFALFDKVCGGFSSCSSVVRIVLG